MEKMSDVSQLPKRGAGSAKRSPGAGPGEALNFEVLNRITDRAFFMALQMIDIANHKRPEEPKGEPKVGGHPSACASSQHILSAIHLVTRSPEDYLACKPHVSPMDHALNYLLGNFREPDGSPMPKDRQRIAMRNLRHYSKEEPVFQSYHAEADPDSYRFFPSGSVGIPPVNALYTALAYDFVKDHGFKIDEKPTFWCLMGDSEFREGSLMEAMPDAGERQLSNLVWIVDYNRQNLDGTRVLNEEAFNGSDADRIVRIAEANGWRAVKLKHGKKREKLFAQPGGAELKRVLDEEFTDFEFQALLEANRPELTRKTLLQKSSALKKFLGNLSDEEVQEAFTNLAGHDLQSLVEVFEEAKHNNVKPTLVVAYTIKGRGLRCQAMSGNHSALPEGDELVEIAEKLGASVEDPFAEFDENSQEHAYLQGRHDVLVKGIDAILEQVNERKATWIEFARNQVQWPADLEIGAIKFNPVAHTQWMWGQIAAKIDRLAREIDKAAGVKLSPSDQEWSKVAKYFLTMAPDVGSSTNTSPNMNGKLYGDIGQEDFEKLYEAKDEKAPDVIPRISTRSGHLRFEIAEGNCMSAAGSFGKFFYFTGIPLFPAMTIYDFFIKRAHDQFYYNLYWHSSFATMGTPSGVTLAAEGAQHSWKSDFQIPNCVTWEPCFAKELEWIMADMFRRHFTKEDVDREGILIRCVTKGIVQKELATRLKAQTRFNGQSEAEMLETIRQEMLEGGAYALIDYRGYEDYTPGDNVVHLFTMGALGGEAIKASDELRKKGIYANVFIVSSPDLLLGNYAYHNNYAHLKETLGVTGNLYLNPKKAERLESAGDWYAVQGSRIPVVSVHDGEPGLLDNIGSVVGVKQKTLAIRKTSKSGTVADIYHLHGIDAEGIVAACEESLTETAAETFTVNPSLLQS
jgi:pyruvate dehydrogenase E1 component